MRYAPFEFCVYVLYILYYANRKRTTTIRNHRNQTGNANRAHIHIRWPILTITSIELYILRLIRTSNDYKSEHAVMIFPRHPQIKRRRNLWEYIWHYFQIFLYEALALFSLGRLTKYVLYLSSFIVTESTCSLSVEPSIL